MNFVAETIHYAPPSLLPFFLPKILAGYLNANNQSLCFSNFLAAGYSNDCVLSGCKQKWKCLEKRNPCSSIISSLEGRRDGQKEALILGHPLKAS